MTPGYTPPLTWTSNYLPDYPQSAWNPGVQLYDSADPQVLRWQDRAMARASIDLAISSWWGVGTYEDQALGRAIRTCKSVQWCIYYEEEAYGDPPVTKICADIKSVLDRFGPTRNYAKIDGKWLVFIYGAGGSETAERWRQAKAILAADGYPVYLNADGGDTSSAHAPDPWDAVHGYSPVVHYGFTDTPPDVDDSAWVSPGFWKIGDAPVLLRSLDAFKAACTEAVSHRRESRFILIETWNEWHEGTQIESGQEIDPDPTAYRSAGYDYRDDFIDAVALATKPIVRWSPVGSRLRVPVLLGANDLIWEPEVVAESASECRIPAEDVRIGKQVLVPASGTLTLYIRARARGDDLPRTWEWPAILIYVDDKMVARGKVPSPSTLLLKATTEANKGLHTLEIGMDVLDAGVWSLIVNSLDVRLTVR